MEKALVCLGVFVASAGVFFVSLLLSVFGGWITGWCLQHIFPWAGEYVVRGLQLLHFEVQMTQLPMFTAVLGFVGGFFKSVSSSSKR